MAVLRSLVCVLVLYVGALTAFGQESVEKKSFVERFFQRLAMSKTDTTYAVRNAYRFILKPKLGTSFGFVEMTRHDNNNQGNYELRSEPMWKAGANFTYRNLTIGFQNNVNRLFGGSETKDSEYTASAYGGQMGGDFLYNVSSSYTISDKNNSDWSERLEGFRTTRLQANGYYVFNHRKFSFPAAFTQSYRQLKSCGSVIAGLSLNLEKLEFDVENNPKAMNKREGVAAIDNLKEVTYRSFDINVGYAYNFVLGRRWMLHGSAMPSFTVLRKARLEYEDSKDKLKVKNFNVGGIVRVGVLWDVSKHFCGFTTVMNINSLGRRPVEITDFYVRTRMFYGFRFNL